MDVICERCNTEYEFDETLLSARGTSVKCTNCGHVFKVYPRGAELGKPASHWRLKRPDGTTDSIDSLRELQRRISNGELTPNDEISRGDEGWKRLGAIPELETFFQAAGVQIPSPRMRSPIPPAPSRDRGVARESSIPPGRRLRQPTLLGVSPGPFGASARPVPAPAGPEPGSVSGPASVAASEPATAPEPASAAGPEPASALEPPEPGLEALRDSFEPRMQALRDSSPGGLESLRDSSEPGLEALRDSREGIADAEFEEAPRVPGRRGTPPPAYVDDEDIPDLPARGWSPLSWLLLAVVVGGLALVAAQWQRVAGLFGFGGDPARVAASVTEGDDSMALGEPKGYERAIEAYGQAVDAGGQEDPRVLAKLSSAYAMAAQAKLDDGQAGVAVESLQAAALGYARQAASLDPRNFEAKLAEADALRLAGQYDAARAVLDEARGLSFSRTAEAFRVDAELSAAEAGGGLEHGLQSARQAVALSPDGVPFLLLLARAEAAAGHRDRAEEALTKVLASHPGHSVATKLLAELAASAPKPATAPGSAAEPAPETASESASESASGSASGSAAETAPASAPKPAAAPKPPPSTAKVKRPAPAPRKPAAPPKPSYDEYDQLTKAAQADDFVDGRPPVRDYEWQMSRGWDELAAGHHARARAFFESALEVQPGSADAMNGLGQVSMATEDFASAARYFRVAAERGHPDGYFDLGRAYERLGKQQEAVSAYFTYLKRNPSGRHAAVARAAIKRLEPRARLPEPESTEQPNTEPAEGSESPLP